MKKLSLFSALISFPILFISCGGGSSDTNPITSQSYATITGKIDSNTVNTLSIKTNGINVLNETIGYITAVSVENNQIIAVSSMVNNDGSFSLQLLKDKNYTFSLLNENGKPVFTTEREMFEIYDDDNVDIKLQDIDNDGYYEVSIFINNGNIKVENYPTFTDLNNNGILDNIENIDIDNDGIADIMEFFSDADNDGILDSMEDNNYNGIPDLIEDINQNGKLDLFEDLNGNMIKDAFEYIHQHRYNDFQNNTGVIIENLPVEELSEEEKTALIYMWNEEKMAKDLYYALYEEFEQYPTSKTFKNIAERSETTHQEIMELLLNKYQISIDEQPYTPDRDLENDYPRGKYSLSEIENLYNDLLSQGSVSIEEALKVGCIVEVVDVEDLNEEIAKTDNQDITTAFENLRQGSYNHYWAFDNALKTIGVEEGCCVLGEEYCKTPEDFPVSNNSYRGNKR